MTKADLVESAFEKAGYSKKDVSDVVDSVFETIKDTLERAIRSRYPDSATLT